MKSLTRLAACMFTLSFTMIFTEAFAQATGNNNPVPGKFLGLNGPQNLEFRTNNTTRMQMMQNGFSNINGFNIDRSGFLGLSQDPNFFTGGAASPFSLLHLNGDNNAGAAQQLGYRNCLPAGY